MMSLMAVPGWVMEVKRDTSGEGVNASEPSILMESVFGRSRMLKQYEIIDCTSWMS